jgi:hypothetical protein
MSSSERIDAVSEHGSRPEQVSSPSVTTIRYLRRHCQSGSCSAAMSSQPVALGQEPFSQPRNHSRNDLSDQPSGVEPFGISGRWNSLRRRRKSSPELR